MTDKAKQLSKSTKVKIQKYVQFTQAVLLIAAGVCAVLAAVQLKGSHVPDAVRYFAGLAGVYVLIEGLVKAGR